MAVIKTSSSNSRTSSRRAANLTSAALALTGMQGHAAGASSAQLEKPEISYNRVHYEESDNRMEVDADQFSVIVPFAGRWQTKFNYIRDKTSGASPIFYTANDDGGPNMVLTSHATIKDTRDVVDLTASYFGDDRDMGINIGKSKEDDYESNFLSIDYKLYKNEKNTTYSIGAAHADDEVWTSTTKDNPFYEPPIFRDREKSDIILGYSQILSKNSLIEANLTYSRSSGYLADPYKKILVFGRGVVDEVRPDKRIVWLLAGRYSRYYDSLDGALHIDYRMANDDWGSDSHTLELRWNQAVGDSWIVSPSVRYYTQHSADFYAPFFSGPTDDGNASADYRLAGFGALSYKISVFKELPKGFDVSIDYELYDRKKALESSDSNGNKVDDYDYSMISFHLGYNF